MKYLHIDSKHRTGKISNASNHIEIHLNGFPINNVIRCAVKQFTMANTIHNVTDFNKLILYEEKVGENYDKAITEHHEIILETGLKTTTEIIQDLQNKFNSIHSGTGNKLLINATVDEERYVTVEITRTANNSSANKRFFQGFDNISQLIHSLGLEALMLGYFQDTKTEPPLNNANAQFTIIGNHPSFIENDHGIFITSNELNSGNTFECVHSHLGMVNKPCNILEFVQFNVPKYNYLHYTSSNNTHFHYLNEKNLQKIDIVIRDKNGKAYTWEEIPDYNLVLQFECSEHHEQNKELQKAYDNEGYRIAHTPQKISFR